jgi:hypothetical protein
MLAGSGSAASTCADSFTVQRGKKLPGCQLAVSPSTGTTDTRFDLSFAATGSRADLFVDGRLFCTQPNPLPGRYDCFLTGSAAGPGTHMATLVVNGCAGPCQQSVPFTVSTSPPSPGGKK